jgi:hypothetical protein
MSAPAMTEIPDAGAGSPLEARAHSQGTRKIIEAGSPRAQILRREFVRR